MGSRTSDSPDTNTERPLLRGTRVDEEDDETEYREAPRLGRRESEPHSFEITYLYDVLTTNFPDDHVLWDLHHYFTVNEGQTEIDIQFDISYFRNFKIPTFQPSYRASNHQNRVPTLAINILSRSTLYKDLSINIERCKVIGIPFYVLFNPYMTQPNEYKAPFLRVYHLASETQIPVYTDIREAAIMENNSATLNPNHFVDLGEELPFKLGIMKTDRKYADGVPVYHIIMVDKNTGERYLTLVEQERQRAEKAEEEIRKLKGLLNRK